MPDKRQYNRGGAGVTPVPPSRMEGEIAMNCEKKSMELTGYFLVPIQIGTSAFIQVADGMLRTSRVLNMQAISQTEVQFETLNTNYHLHISREVPV